MKILHLVQGYFPAVGGTEWLIQQVSEELVRQFGDEVTVFTTNCLSGEGFFSPHLPRLPPGWEEYHGVKIRRFEVNSRLSWIVRKIQFLPYHLSLPGNQYLRALAGGPIIPGLKKAVEEHPAEVIAASSFPLRHMFAALEAAEKTRRPCVFHGGLHPQDHWGFHRPMIYQAIQRASYYIANTDFEAAYVQQQGVPSERVETVGVGTHWEAFAKVDGQEAKRALGLSGKPVVGFIGQISAVKGADTLVRAMPWVWRTFPETRLLIAGSKTSFTWHLENLIAALPERDRKKILLIYNFPEEEKPGIFSALDVFAYPSGFESFGISYLEAWSCKKPVIGCRRGAVPWVIQGGKDGLLVPYQDEKMLAESINLLLSNPQWARSLGEAGFQKVVRRYNWPEIARRFRLIYQRVCASPSAP